MFKKNMETKGHGSIRKTKAYGAVAVLSLFGLFTVANGQEVSANEVSVDNGNVATEATDTSLTVQAANVSSETSASEVVANPVTESVAEPVVETPIEAVATPISETTETPIEAVATPVNEVVAEPVAETVENVATPESTQLIDETASVVTNADTTQVIETPELAKAVTDAKAAGMTIKKEATVNLGTATTEAEEAALKALAIQKQAEQAARITAITEDYKAELQEAKTSLTEDGHLSRIEAQNLTLISEPNAVLSISGDGKFANKNTVVNLQSYDNDWVKALYAIHSDDYYNSATTSQSGAWIVDGSKNGRMSEGYAMVAREGDTIVATYENLQNVSVGDVKIVKAVYQYDIKQTSDSQGYINLVIYKDPTVTIDNDSLNEIKSKDVRITLTPKYFDEQGNQVDLSQFSSLLSIASLNYDYYAGQVESIQNLQGVEFIPITGSTIKNNNGVISATSNNSWTAPQPYYNGVSKWDASEWDVSDGPNEYYGAGVLKVTSKNFSFDLVSSTYSETNDVLSQWKGYWQAITSQVKASGIVTNPVASYNLYSYDVAIPKTGNVVVDYQDKNGSTISPRVTDTPESNEGTPYDTTDNKPVQIVTTDGRTYRIDTNATKGSETGSVVEGTTQVVYIYDEVLGNVLIDYKDTNGTILKTRVTDTPNSSTGTAYDTTDNKPKEIQANGTIYRIKPELTVGQETGKVVEGTTLVTYVYEAVKGTVTVHYEDENGNKIEEPKVDTPASNVNTPYDTTDNKPNEIKKENGKTYRIIPDKTKGNENGRVVEGDTPVTYVYKEIKGDVIVDYKDKNGNTLHPRVTDTPETSTGTAYDTTDQKKITIVTSDGKTYRIDESKTTGIEIGKVVEGTTQVVYIYDEVLGSVIVHYEDEDGKTIKTDVIDTPETSTNTPYDTGDNKPKTIVTDKGQTYELVPGLTRGVEVGRVAEGKTHVTYVYKELFGNVLVNYVDEEGNVIKDQVEDMPQTSTGVDYSTLDNKLNAIKSGKIIYNIIPTKTVGKETGKIVVGTTEVTYVYKAVEAEPVKTGTSENGTNVDGKVLLAGSTINYEVSIDNDQFKGIVGLTEKDLNTPLIVIEDHDDKTTPVLEAVRVVLAEDKTKVQSGFTTTLYTSLTEAPKLIQDYIAANNITVDGQFSATVSDDAVAYNKNYVLTGTNLKLVFPVKINEDVKDASEIKNTAYQLDFSGSHVTNVVTNTTPKIDPKKDVTFTIEDGLSDKNSLDGKEVKVGDVINFELKSSYFPANRADAISDLAYVDTWSDLVSYDGSHTFFALTDILLKDGSVIAKGTDITKYIEQVINYDGRTVRYSVSRDLLNSISLNSELQIAGYMQVKVEKAGTVKNTFAEFINEVETFSNTVTVEAKTPPTPQTPQLPQVPTEETPTVPSVVVPTLPNTGEEQSYLAMMGMGLIAGAGFTYLSTRRRKTK